ncbi:parallel beta-helix repeat protein-like protein [Setomelanomma holmii]|uniref:Parallel beta-helix repeat protein-like protein n=1 Tax=Setomelanomma holmii TaxID=210430 RepID=A0A9P4HDK3_9PLEO|nr:parallel beta-helix repeat protein-like protein [Setomelanomma holmii]
MVHILGFAAVAALVSTVSAQCGSGTPDATVTHGYTGDYLTAIQRAVDSISSGQRVSVLASGSIGASTITIQAGKTFEGCGTINAAVRSGRRAIEVTNAANVKIPYLTMSGNVYFGLRFSGTSGLTLSDITFDLTTGMGIRFDRDLAANTNVKMGTINCKRTSSHCVETWNINQLEIGSIIARNVGEFGLLLQAVTNAKVGLVDGDNVAAGNGYRYATVRFANRAARLNNAYNTNICVPKVKSRGGGRGIFCVSESGGAEIGSIDLADNGNNAIANSSLTLLPLRKGKVEKTLSVLESLYGSSDEAVEMLMAIQDTL